MKLHWICAVAPLVCTAPALAQRAQENAVASATDGFGATVGNERVGVYTATSVRGFSPITAGNRRLDGLYFDLGGNGLSNRLVAGSTVRVGLTALDYAFPAPSGIVDYRLRRAGPESLLSLVVGRPAYGGATIELDGQARIGEALSVAGGIGAASNLYTDGRRTDAWSAAILPTLAVGESLWTGFYGIAYGGGSVAPVMTTTGAVLPPIVDTSGFRGQRWIDNSQLSHTYGISGDVALSDELSLRLGAFESRSTRRRTFADLFLDVQPDGSAVERVIADPVLPARWTSGEARLSWSRRDDLGTHRIVLALRGRDKRLESGGSDAATLGPIRIGTYRPAPEPDFRFTDPTVSRVRQGAVGLAYLGQLDGGIDVDLGLQRVDYRSDFTGDGRMIRSKARPILYNAALAYAPAGWIGVYAGTARGLEESAPAPPSARNRDDAVPAARTRQIDAGVRLVLGDIRLVAGGFRIERPYYSVGQDGVYRALGEVRNSGVELSLAGRPIEPLSLVAGLVLMDPRVVGEGRQTGRAGDRPVGSTVRTARLDAEYAIAGIEGLSLTLALQHSGPIVASTRPYAELGDRQLTIPAGTTADVGARLKTAIGAVPVTLKAQLLNAFDVRRLQLSSSNAFISADRRRFTLQLAADF